jgi:hypothetical protein
VGSWDKGEIGRKMSAEKLRIKERGLIMRMKYSLLKEKMKQNECRWSKPG